MLYKESLHKEIPAKACYTSERHLGLPALLTLAVFVGLPSPRHLQFTGADAPQPSGATLG